MDFGKRYGFIAVLTAVMILCFGMSGCAGTSVPEEEYDDGLTRAERLSEITELLSEYSKEKEAGSESDKEDIKEPEFRVCVGSGFEKASNKKLAVIVNNAEDISAEDVYFSVMKRGTEDLLFTGGVTGAQESKNDPSDTAVKVFYGDFTDFEEKGDYVIICYCRNGTFAESSEFAIEDNHYQNLLTIELLHLSKDESIPDIKKDGIDRRLFLQIADMLMAYEFFDRELTETSESRFVSKSLELGGRYIDELLKYEAEDGGIMQEITKEDSLCCDYLFCAVLAKYAEDTKNLNGNNLKELKRSSEAAFKKAERSYMEITEPGTDLFTARYWAEAELYRLTGEKKYRRAAEKALETEIPVGISGDSFGDLGNLAYLTAHSKTDLDLSKKIMDSMIGRAVETAQEGIINDQMLMTLKPWEKTDEVIEGAILLTFANLTGQSTIYVKASEEAVEWLYGMNALMEPAGKGGAYRNSRLFILNGLAGSYVAD